MKYLTHIFLVIFSLTVISNILPAQKINFIAKDTTTYSTDKLDLMYCVYNENLLKWAWEQDSVNIWVLKQDSCVTNGVLGIPWCEDCSLGANFVLQNAYQLSYIDSTVIMGSCWDYLNAIYSKLEAQSFKKNELYMTKKAGPFAPKNMLQPGDWVYHINHQWYGVEHSAIFVCWKDYENGIAITLSYMGMNRYKTAQFGEYNLNSVYAIFRLEDQMW
jgi:hypothetical protein